MRHQDHGFGAVVNGIFDGRDRTGDTLRVGDVLIRIERDVEIDLQK
jgi:hypothetical protein